MTESKLEKLAYRIYRYQVLGINKGVSPQLGQPYSSHSSLFIPTTSPVSFQVFKSQNMQVGSDSYSLAEKQIFFTLDHFYYRSI